jgi:hypothetical protein
MLNAPVADGGLRRQQPLLYQRWSRLLFRRHVHIRRGICRACKPSDKLHTAGRVFRYRPRQLEPARKWVRSGGAFRLHGDAHLDNAL